MLHKVGTNLTAYTPKPLSMRCPGCHKQVMLEPIGVNDMAIPPDIWAGQRRCPNGECCTLVFILHRPATGILEAYPPERLDFDVTSIPGPVLKAFEEAAGCHAAQCYVAAALMVRKTLEEVCRDRGASGANLKARIESLRDKVVVPKELLEGLDVLRLLGNDAAHVESRTFDEIGVKEVEVAFEFTREVLKAVYQYASLLDKLRGLKPT